MNLNISIICLTHNFVNYTKPPRLLTGGIMKHFLGTILLTFAMVNSAFAASAFITNQKVPVKDNVIYKSTYKIMFCEKVENDQCTNPIKSSTLSKTQKGKLIIEALDKADYEEYVSSANEVSQDSLAVFLIKEFSEHLNNGKHRTQVLDFIKSVGNNSIVISRDYVWQGGPGYEEWEGWTEIFDAQTDTMYIVKDYYYGGED